MSPLNGFCCHGNAVYSNVLKEIRDSLDFTYTKRILLTCLSGFFSAPRLVLQTYFQRLTGTALFLTCGSKQFLQFKR